MLRFARFEDAECAALELAQQTAAPHYVGVLDHYWIVSERPVGAPDPIQIDPPTTEGGAA